MRRTNIGWSDYSSNPVRARYTTVDGVVKQGWACVLASAGCANCYSETLNRRFGTGLDFTIRNMNMVQLEVYLDEKELQHMLRFRPRSTNAGLGALSQREAAGKPKEEGERPVRPPAPLFKNGRSRPIVFVGDMTDLFGGWMEDEWLDRLFAVMALRSDVDWLLLTKRPERMREYLSAGTGRQLVLGGGAVPLEHGCGKTAWDRVFHEMAGSVAGREWRRVNPQEDFCGPNGLLPTWPLPNVGLGVSVENQATADERTPELLATPAAWRFISAEPLLGPLDLEQHLHDSDCWGLTVADDAEGDPKHGAAYDCICNEPREDHIDWVVVGGESGPRRRPCEVEWIESIVRQCDAAGVSVFVKQDSALRPGQQGRIPDDLWARKAVPG